MIDLKKITLTIGIAVVFAFFIYFSIEVIAPSPQYEDYCTYAPPYPAKIEFANCLPLRDEPQISDQCYRKKGTIQYAYNTTTGCPIKASCDYCSRDYTNADNHYQLRIFWVSAVISIIALIAGMYLPLSIEAIASGFMLGGIFILIQSTVHVFISLGRYSRVIILAAELILLVWIGIKKVSDLGKKKKEERHARTKKRLPS